MAQIRQARARARTTAFPACRQAMEVDLYGLYRQAKYGHPVVLLETFVEGERFRGTVYRAANWQRAGVTAGRTRQDRHTSLQVPVKDLYLYPLGRSFRELLCA
jgi:hypothetical protein